MLLVLFWVALALVTRYAVLSNPAFEPDNILSLSLGDRSFGRVFGRFFDYLPYYRPVSILSIWVQYAIHGLSGIYWYFLVNVVLLGLCAHVFALLLLRAGAGLVPSLLAGTFFAVHPNVLSFVTIIGERGNILVLLFGLLAMVAWCRLTHESPAKARSHVAMLSLLMLSALAKELGLAFAFAILGASLWLAWTRGQRSLIAAACSAFVVVAVVVGLFLTMVGLDFAAGYPECRVFFTECWSGSYWELGPLRTSATLLYTAAANVVAAFLPFAFDGNGALVAPAAYSARSVMLSVVFTAAALFGIVKGPPVVRVASLALILGHGLASAVLFRWRNHMVSDAAAIALACFGLKEVFRIGAMHVAIRAAGLVVLVAIIGYRAIVSYEASRAWVERERRVDPGVALVYVPRGASKHVIEVQRARFVESRTGERRAGDEQGER